ncbi:MAG: hypothetical protein Q9169_003352 [Polycauliona sp. 2 TL-2023]
MANPEGVTESFAGSGAYLTHDRPYKAIDPLKADLAGKRVLIVGSAAVVQALAISYATAGASHIAAIGAHCELTTVTGHVKKAAKDADRNPPRILIINLLDIKSPTSIDNAAALIQANFEGIDIIVMDSGALEEAKSNAESNMDKWWDSWTTNLRGSYFIARAFLPMMLKAGDKTIVFVASAVADCIETHEMSAYGTSMFAQLRLAAFLAAEYGDEGVLPFCIHLGNVTTNASAGDVNQSLELFADTVVYLTKRKRKWLSGRYINSTWGKHVLANSLRLFSKVV